MAEPEIDVLIPAYNAAATLEASLASIRAQSLADIRIIVVDDGSSDQTPAMLARLAQEEPRLAVITQANGGIVAALNAGLTHCRARLLARFDADDLAFPNRLAMQRDYLSAHPDCVAVGCAIAHIDEHGAPLSGLPAVSPIDNVDAAWAPAREPYIVHPFLMARRDAVMAAGGYRHVPQSEDSDLYWRLSERGRLHNLEATLGQYRVHQASLSSQSIVSGRVMAAGSQLGALSALRRMRGVRDLAFEPGLHTALKQARTLEAMSALAGAQLEGEEMARFKLMAGVKLMELAAYRPYELEASDCAFIRAALGAQELFSAENRGHIRWHVTETARRLLRKGKAGEAMTLAPPALYPRILAKTLMG